MKTPPFHHLSEHTDISVECHVFWVAGEPTFTNFKKICTFRCEMNFDQFIMI